MKSTSILMALAFILVSANAFALPGEGRDRSFDRTSSHTKFQPEIVKWVGEVKDDRSTHTTEHRHELEFVKKDDGKRYDIVDSPELVKLHHETGKSYLAEIEAEKTPRFLFWGGNLIVKNFKVLEETSDVIPHAEPVRRSSRRFEGRGR